MDGQQWAAGPNNQLTDDTQFTYAFDNEGNLLTRTRKSQDLLPDHFTRYEWDWRNWLTKVTFQNNSGVNTKVVEYGYDAFNRWIGKRVDDDGSGGANRVEYLVYDGTQIVLRFDGAPGAAVLSHRYLWGPAVDQILADDLLGGELLWPLTDNLGTVRDLINTAGTVREHRVYDGFGKVTYPAAPVVDHLFGFTGRPLDQDTRLQNNLNRWYDAGAARWLSEDPIGFAAGDENLYRYCVNTPTNATDPTGLDEQWEREVNGYRVKYLVAKGEFSLSSLIALVSGIQSYPGPWGQPATRTSGSIRTTSGAETTVNLTGGSVCNTIVPARSGSSVAGEIRARVRLPVGCYEVLWQWEVSASGNAQSGVATIRAWSGVVSSTKKSFGPFTLNPGFRAVGTELTRVNVTGGWLDSLLGAKADVPIATYVPTLSRSDDTGSDGKPAHSGVTGRIKIMQIKKVRN